MLQGLITSRVRTKLLTLLLMQPEQEYHLKGLVRVLDENNNALRRELNRLEGIGLLHSQRRGGARFYRVNRLHPLYPELKSLVHKTTGLGQTLRDALVALGPVDCAFIYGSFAKGEEHADSDVDLMIVGHIDLARLQRVLRDLEQQLGREINATVYTPQEFTQRRHEGDAFLRRVLLGPKIVLIGDADALD